MRLTENGLIVWRDVVACVLMDKRVEDYTSRKYTLLEPDVLHRWFAILPEEMQADLLSNPGIYNSEKTDKAYNWLMKNWKNLYVQLLLLKPEIGYSEVKAQINDLTDKHQLFMMVSDSLKRLEELRDPVTIKECIDAASYRLLNVEKADQ